MSKPRFRKTYEIGTKFNRLAYQGEDEMVPMPSGGTKRTALFQCDCGSVRRYQMANVIHGNSKQCESCRIAALPKTKRQFKGDQVNRKQAMKAYKRNALKRNLVWELTSDQFDQLTAKDCFYCGTPPSNEYNLKTKEGSPRAEKPFIYSGIDRIDSSQGYTWENVVPCCRLCNMAKQQYTMPEFIAWVARLTLQLQEYENGTRMAPRTIFSEEVWREARRLLDHP